VSEVGCMSARTFWANKIRISNPSQSNRNINYLLALSHTHNSVNTCCVKRPTEIEILPSETGHPRRAQMQYSTGSIGGPI
jgi:hypothetical protein